MLHACVQRFDVTENLENFCKILGTKHYLNSVVHYLNSVVHVAVDQASDNEKIPSAAVEPSEELLAK